MCQHLGNAFCQHVVELTQELWQHILHLSCILLAKHPWQHILNLSRMWLIT
jgi:hypothetical protein